MRYVSFEYRQSRARAWGLESGDQVIDLQAAGKVLGIEFPPTLVQFIGMGREAWPRAEAAMKAVKAGKAQQHVHGRDLVRLLAPILRPPKNIFALGPNYAAHVAEDGPDRDLPRVPVYFSKAATAIIGPDEPAIADPRLTNQMDWEAELGVVVGVGGRWIPREKALEHVFGYTIIIDLTARDQQADRPEGQWFLGKSLDTFCPMGPALVSADEIVDPQCLDLSLRVNGIEKQSANTRQMIFSVAAIIADLSQYITLEPGDVITTGTPKGGGWAQTPPQFLHPGDVVEAKIGRIGLLRTPIKGPSS